MSLEWNSTWETGLSWMDAQHRELFERIFSLLDAVLAGKEKNEVANLLPFLEHYAIAHFGSEETAMMQCGYPDYFHHKGLHEEFNESFAQIKIASSNGGLTPASR